MNEIEQKEICENCKKRNNCNHRELIHKDGCSVHDCDYYFQVVLNEENQKEIEEMAKILKGYCCLIGGNPTKGDCYQCKQANASCYNYAEHIYNAGYRNVKDKVVLTKEEQERILNATEKRIKQLKNELNDYKQRYESAKKRCEQLVQSSCEALEKKGKVVLDKEEYARLHNLEINYEDTYENYREYAIENNKLKEELRQASELKAETIKLAKQETARDIFNALGFITYRKQGKAYIFDVKELRELAKQYGVEVE